MADSPFDTIATTYIDAHKELGELSAFKKPPKPKPPPPPPEPPKPPDEAEFKALLEPQIPPVSKRTIIKTAVSNLEEAFAALTRPLEEYVAKPFAAGLAAAFDPESYIPSPTPGLAVSDVKLQQLAAEYKQETGRAPTFAETTELQKALRPLPWGVYGALEMMPWMVVPSAAVTRGALLGFKAKALGRIDLVEAPVLKSAYQAVANVFDAAAKTTTPIVKVEEGIAQAFGITVKALSEGVKVAKRSLATTTERAVRPQRVAVAADVPIEPRKRTIAELREAGIVESPVGPSADAIDRAIEATLRDSKVLRRVERRSERVFDDLEEDFSFSEIEFLEAGTGKDIADIRQADVVKFVREELGKNESRLTSQRSRLVVQEGLEAEAEAVAIERGIQRIGLTEPVTPVPPAAPQPALPPGQPPTVPPVVAGAVVSPPPVPPVTGPPVGPTVPSLPSITTGGLPSGRVPGGLAGVPPTLPPRDSYTQLLAALEPERNPIIKKLRRGLPMQFYDRNYPLKTLEKATGIPAHKASQVVPGAVAAGEDIVRRFYAPILKPVEKDFKFLEQYMTLRRMDDILARNPQARLPGNISGFPGQQRALKTLADKVGPQRFEAIEQAAKDLWKLNDEQVLSEYVREGLITAGQRRDMLSSHPHYIPFQRADFTELVTAGLSASPEANITSVGIKTMGLEGSERALANPLQRLLQEPIKARTVIFRNRAAKSIVRALEELQSQTGEQLVRYVEPVKPGVPVKKAEISQRWDTISFFEDGVRNRVEVPSVYGQIAKGLEAEPDNIALQVVRALNAPLRYGATTYNPFFLPVNVLRDAMSAMFREKLFPFGPDYFAGLWAVIRKNATFSEAAQSGALLSGVVETMNPSRIPKNPLGGITVRNPWDAITLPFRLMEHINIMAERGIRVASFKKLRAEGLDQLEAAVRSRDATVDFAKSGNTMRVINQIIPFTNAATQGSANIARTIRDHPVRSLAFASMFVSMTVMERINNMRFETSVMIPHYEYTRNWVIQFGEGTRKDGTQFPVYAKIPKGEIAAMFTFPAEALFHLAQQGEDRSAVELLLAQGWEAGRTISPVELGGVTGYLPPAFETGVGLQTGVDPFTNIPIVPRREEGLPPEQQFGAQTSTTAVGLGELFKVSPRLINFALNDIAAGTGQAINWLLSQGLEALGYKPTVFGEEVAEAKYQPEGIEALSKVPGISRFVGTRGTQQERRGWELFNQAVEDTNREFNKLPDVNVLGIRLGQVGKTISGKELTPAERARYQRLAGQEAIKLVASITFPEGTTLSSKDRYIRARLKAAKSRARILFGRGTQPTDVGEAREPDFTPPVPDASVPVAQRWKWLQPYMHSGLQAALQGLWAKPSKPLSPPAEQQLRLLFEKFPFGQTDFNEWAKMTLRQAQSAAANAP